jgi:hypothetical protein
MPEMKTAMEKALEGSLRKALEVLALQVFQMIFQYTYFTKLKICAGLGRAPGAGGDVRDGPLRGLHPVLMEKIFE